MLHYFQVIHCNYYVRIVFDECYTYGCSYVSVGLFVGKYCLFSLAKCGSEKMLSVIKKTLLAPSPEIFRSLNLVTFACRSSIECFPSLVSGTASGHTKI